MALEISLPALCGENNTFWDSDLVFNTNTPELSECFQQSILVWAPCLILCIMAIPYFLHLTSLVTMNRPRSTLYTSKMAIGVLLCCIALADFIQGLISGVKAHPLHYYISPAVRFATFILSFIIMRLEFKKGLHTSGVMFVFWLSFVFTGLFSLISNILLAKRTNGKVPDMYRFITFLIQYAMLLLEFLLSLKVDLPIVIEPDGLGENIRLMDHKKISYNESSVGKGNFQTKKWPKCPESKASFLSKITFWWITKLLVRGYRKAIRFEEYTDIMPSEKCDNLVPIFETAWEKCSASVQKSVVKERAEIREKRMETSKEKVVPNKSPEEGTALVEVQDYVKDRQDDDVKGPDPPAWPMVKALLISNRGILLEGAILKLIGVFWEFLNPILLNVVISWVSSNDPYVWKGYTLAVLLLVVDVFASLIIQNTLRTAFITGMRCRSIVVTSVYRKALKLSNSARVESTVGQIVNLMSVDAQKIQDFCSDIHELWATPVSMIISIYLLWQQMGVATLGGVAILVVLAPINGVYIVGQLGKLQVAQMIQKDIRIKKLGEILSAIKVIKMYAWEIPFAKLVGDIRWKELETLKKGAYINAFIGVTWFSVPYMISLAIFGTYVLSSSDNYLSPQKAFVTINLIQILHASLSFLPVVLGFAAQVYVSLKRLVRFLTEEELDPTILNRDETAEFAITVENGSFSWDVIDDRPVLEDINLEIADNELIAVVGQVGCGKSSLISTILGETRKLQGRVTLRGNIAYVAQQAWIQNATLRDNILFGKPMDKIKYDSVIEACALQPDLDILPGGDMTEIGEKGINLSGGQKQRVSLARAVYRNDDVYLLDDPLSAVDAHVGKHIFENVIGNKGLLRNKTIVLVTHGVTYLPHVDRIVCLKYGKISECGTYEELLEKRGEFAEFVQTYLTDTTDNDSSEEAPALGRQISEFDEDGEADSAAVRHRKRSRKDSSRKISESNAELTPTESAPGKDQLVDEEEAEVGSISSSVTKAYAKALGSASIVSLVLSLILYTAAQAGTNVWLRLWSDDQVTNGTVARDQILYRLEIYAVWGLVQVIGIIWMSLGVFLGCVYASKSLHRNLLNSILRAPMSFFDRTPVGRIVNRFSSDMDKLDSNIAMFTRQTAVMLSKLISTLILISYSTPIFLVVVVPLMIAYFVIQKVYIKTVRQAKRIDSIHRSPIYTNFDETLVGVATIRAFQEEKRFISKNDRLTDESQICWYPVLIAQRWLGFWLDIVGAYVVFFAGLFAILERDNITGGLAGLSVSFAMQTTVAVNLLVISVTELETNMVSMERIQEYTVVPSEAPWVIEDKRPPTDWPTAGEVEFREYSTRYRSDLDLVLKDISFSIKSKEKIGVVGRTGAGKSSMTLALYRIIEAAGGSILVDGREISEMGLHDLRSKLTIIPQDPMLFSGTLRENLDPIKTESDSTIWKALEHAHLKDFVSRLKEGLDYECGESGSSLSVGQRQLVCLARALLKKSKILILDEATAAVDLKTDDLIQDTIRNEFSECTVLTIAHRLNTILDYDRVLVLDRGSVAEFAPPQNLLQDTSSRFHSMAKDAGIV